MWRSSAMPKLSILLVTYNHAKYIRAALDSILAQKFAGPIEIVIADDSSTDATLEMIRAYEGRDRRFHFKYLPAETNVGITRNYQRGFAACAGEYVAVLEGDDYWLSRKKLAHQARFLNRNSAYNLCSVNYYVEDEETGGRHIRVPQGAGHHRTITAQDLIADNLIGNFSTCMYRKSALDALPTEVFDVQSYDWITNICIAADGAIAFLEEPMSVYRLHSNSAWSQKNGVDKAIIQKTLIPQYDAITKGRFHAAFMELVARLNRLIQIAEPRDNATVAPRMSYSDANLVALVHAHALERGESRRRLLLQQIEQHRTLLDLP